MNLRERADPGPRQVSKAIDEVIEQIKQQDAAWKGLAAALGDVAYVLMSAAGSPNVAVAEKLRDSIIALMCCGSEKQIKMLEAQQAQQNQKPDVEALAHLCEERDSLSAQIEQLESASVNLKEMYSDKPGEEGPMAAYGRFMDIAYGDPIRKRLEYCEQQISAMQADMEQSTEPPTPPANEENSTPEANT
jgi:hypothetical protein